MVNIALAQINPVVGDIDGNIDRIVEAITSARDAGAQVVALPELAVTGYAPDDLVFKRAFIQSNVDGVEEVARRTDGVLSVVGFVEPGHDRLYNAAAIC